MDPRSKKPRDFVAASRHLSEEMRRSRLTRMKWLLKYEPLLEEHEQLRRETSKLYKKRCVKIKKDDVSQIERDRTCLPVPITTSGEYGWLATKPEFRLEKYGSYIVKYPEPLKDI